MGWTYCTSRICDSYGLCCDLRKVFSLLLSEMVGGTCLMGALIFFICGRIFVTFFLIAKFGAFFACSLTSFIFCPVKSIVVVSGCLELTIYEAALLRSGYLTVYDLCSTTDGSFMSLEAPVVLKSITATVGLEDIDCRFTE